MEALSKTYAKLLKINNRKGNVFISTKRDVRSGHDADGLTLGLEKDILSLSKVLWVLPIRPESLLMKWFMQNNTYLDILNIKNIVVGIELTGWEN